MADNVTKESEQVNYEYEFNRPLFSFRVPKLSLSRRGYMLNLSCENEFYLHENKNRFLEIAYEGDGFDQAIFFYMKTNL